MTARIWLAAAALVLTLPASLLAQGIHPHAIELSANGGAINLAGASPTQNIHASFGFTGVYNVVKHVAVGAEYMYDVLGTAFTPQGGISENRQQFGGVIRVTLLARRIAPYVVAGGGVATDHGPSAPTLYTRVSTAGGYAAGGAGASIFVTHGFGIRPEFRIEHSDFPTTSVAGTVVNGQTSTNLHETLSIFYQF